MSKREYCYDDDDDGMFFLNGAERKHYVCGETGGRVSE